MSILQLLLVLGCTSPWCQASSTSGTTHAKHTLGSIRLGMALNPLLFVLSNTVGAFTLAQTILLCISSSGLLFSKDFGENYLSGNSLRLESSLELTCTGSLDCSCLGMGPGMLQELALCLFTPSNTQPGSSSPCAGPGTPLVEINCAHRVSESPVLLFLPCLQVKRAENGCAIGEWREFS